MCIAMRVYYTLYVRPFVCPPARPAGEGESKHRKGESGGKFGILAGCVHAHAHENAYKDGKRSRYMHIHAVSYVLNTGFKGGTKVVSKAVGRWFPDGFRWFPAVS